MSDEQEVKQKKSGRRSRRFHLSTLVISSLILLPWLLVALPGRPVTDLKVNNPSGDRCYQHGLPFVFLERATVIHYFDPAVDHAEIARRNLKFLERGIQRQDVDFDTEVRDLLANWEEKPKGIIGSLGTRLFDVPERSFDDWGERFPSLTPRAPYGKHSRFWSNPELWPWTKSSHVADTAVTGEAMRIRWLGLLVDVLLILFVFFAFASFVEYRLKKRGSHFAFSLTELSVAIFVVGSIFAWISIEHQRAAKENPSVDRLLTASKTTSGYLASITLVRGNGLPSLISELFDHRSFLPRLESNLFVPVDRARIRIENTIFGFQSEEIKKLVDAIRNVDFPLEISTVRYPRKNLVKNLLLLKEIDDLITVRRLRFDFSESYADAEGDFDWESQFAFPMVEQLTIVLSPHWDQKRQLQLFAQMKHLKRLSILNLNSEGAAYLSSIAHEFNALEHLDIKFSLVSGFLGADGNVEDSDLDFKLKLPKADKTWIAIELERDVSQRKQLELFESVKHLEYLQISRLNPEGLSYLGSKSHEFPTIEQLNLFVYLKTEPDYDLKFPLLGVEDLKLSLDGVDQAKMLRMFAPFNRFKRFRIQGLRSGGAAYLNSIVDELPSQTWLH